MRLQGLENTHILPILAKTAHKDKIDASRDDIAAHVFVSSGYLGRVFKKELNMSLSEYIFEERMKLAATMLEQSDLYVTSIALNVGFSNFPYFSTQFKKFSGLSPVEYRKRFRSAREPVDAI